MTLRMLLKRMEGGNQGILSCLERIANQFPADKITVPPDLLECINRANCTNTPLSDGEKADIFNQLTSRHGKGKLHCSAFVSSGKNERATRSGYHMTKNKYYKKDR